MKTIKDHPNSRIIPNLRCLTRIEHYEKDHAKKGCSLHLALRPVILMAKLFGVMPLLHAGSSRPQFKLCSWTTLYSCLLLCTVFVVLVFTLFHIATVPTRQQQGVDSASAGTIFYSNAILSMILFIRLSSYWPYLMEEWSNQEMAMITSTQQSIRCLLTPASILLLATCEHAMSVVVAIAEASPDDRSSWVAKYCRASHAFVFSESFLPSYTSWVGVLILVASNVATFAWNFTDLFIILVSNVLTAHFVNFNQQVKLMVTGNRDKKISTIPNIQYEKHYSISWREMRHTFAMLSTLVKTVDSKISAIILLSFCNNVYFICLQLLHGLSEEGNRSVLSTAYFLGSFSFLVCRTMWMTLSAASIHDNSKVALDIIFLSPTVCTEAKRLQQQIISDTIALTGLRFFYVTRNFMLGVAGAIMTYEVVLLQFSTQHGTFNETHGSLN